MKNLQENKKPMSRWVNRLDFIQRKEVVQMYSNGISISAITQLYQVDRSSIRYHLRYAGVYVPNRRPIVTYDRMKEVNDTCRMNFYNRKGEKLRQLKYPQASVDFIKTERCFPKSYAEYVQRQNQRNDIKI